MSARGMTEGIVEAELLGKVFRFRTAPGLFSADRVDDGTRLLLSHLPSSEPTQVFDLGCGYGALGLPVAARFPEATCVLGDRDTLAVEYARRNAEAHGLARVVARPSLGYRDLAADARFDWVLCNVPARIGDAAIAYILGEGARRLVPTGEVRVVVIRDLAPVVERLSQDRGWKVSRVADGTRHTIFALGPLELDAAEHEALYLRDHVNVGGLRLERPHDISEDPSHLREGLPLLLELLPRQIQAGASALVWRGGYGAAALTLASRGARVVATDRDLLATTYTQRNARALGHDVETRESFALPEQVREGERFELCVGELQASAGDEANVRDVLCAAGSLSRGGQALWLGLTRPAKGLMERLVKAGQVRATSIASRGPWSVWRVEASIKR